MRPIIRALILGTMLCLPLFSEDELPDEKAFAKMLDSIDLNAARNTTLSIEESWKKLQGQEGTWTATVVDVTGGRGKAQIYASKSNRPLYRGYNLVLTTLDKATAAALRKGDVFTFKGRYHARKQRRGNPLVLYFSDVQIIRKVK